MITHALRLALAHRVKPFVFAGRPGQPPELDLPNLGIYVHVPFCADPCPFCPYFKETYDPAKAASYADAVKKEIALAGRGLNGRRMGAMSVYFGGGTPALLAGYLPGILGEISRHFAVSGEVGIELHPRGVDAALLAFLRDAGFTMVSLGIQSFHPADLRALGRRDADGRDTVRLAAQAGFHAVDVDLIFGIPGQTAAGLVSDFRTAAECGATQISTYPFIDFTYARNTSKPLGHAAKRALLDALLDEAGKLGFERNSVWTFARKGSPRYSSVTRDHFIGFGPSAASLGLRAFRINTFSLEEYAARVGEGSFPSGLVLDFTPRSRALYWLFWRCYNLDIDGDDFRLLFHRELGDVFRGAFRIGRLLGLLDGDGSRVRLTQRGAYAFHRVEQAYTRQYIDRTWRIAHREALPEKIVLY